jgi:hypothetical protein
MAAAVGRPRKRDIIKRRKDFIGLLAEGVDPAEAAELSGHPAEKALRTLSELGFKLTVLEPAETEAA